MGIQIKQIIGLLARLLPSGGAIGQVLKKASGTDYDVSWVDDSDGWSRHVRTVSDLVTSSTTGVDSGIETATLDINSEYEFEGQFVVTNAATSAIAVISLVLPTGGEVFGSLYSVSASYVQSLVAGGYTGLSAAASAGSTRTLQIKGVFTVAGTAGTAKIQFRRSGGSGNVTMSMKVSFLKIRKI